MIATSTYHPRSTSWHKLRQLVLDIDAPQRMDKLSTEQFIAVAVARRMKDETEARASIVWALLDMDNRDARTCAGFKLLSERERYQLGALADPFMAPSTMTTTPLKRFRTRAGQLRIVHADLFRKVTAEEWGKADDEFISFQRTGELDDLRAMAAVLYTLGDPSREERLYGEGHAPTMRAVNLLSEAELLGIWQMWSCQRLVYEKESPMPFGRGEKKARKQGRNGWRNAMLDMAGGKFGPHASVLGTPVRDLFTQMHREMWDAQQAELNAKAGRR